VPLYILTEVRTPAGAGPPCQPLRTLTPYKTALGDHAPASCTGNPRSPDTSALCTASRYTCAGLRIRGEVRHITRCWRSSAANSSCHTAASSCRTSSECSACDIRAAWASSSAPRAACRVGPRQPKQPNHPGSSGLPPISGHRCHQHHGARPPRGLLGRPVGAACGAGYDVTEPRPCASEPAATWLHLTLCPCRSAQRYSACRRFATFSV
jgi:hypothetical protein